MDQKEEAIKQINTIKESLVDSQKFVPYAPNALIMWGIVTGILFLFTQEVIERFGIVSGGLFLAIFISVSAYMESKMIRKINKKYEVEALTRKQKFIESIYIFISIFAILMTAILFKAGAINLIYVVWIFLIGLTSYIAGHILNQKSFTYHGIVSFMIAFGIVYLIYFTHDGLQDSGLSYLFRALGVVIIGGGYIWLGLLMKKESYV
ncbi:MAG: hypothetical protein K0U47_01080 [Epsilonproteobacteria bacterium]|nr:hypothetical protein [Campylobacterota bacterium]